MFDMVRLPVPIVSVIIGEGGSGGALGIAVADKVLMMEHAVYSVIPPEGCAAILWRDPERKAEAARALNLTAQGARDFGIIDEIIAEPLGGAHQDWNTAAENVGAALERALDAVSGKPADVMLSQRYEKFRNMGRFAEMEMGEAA
jgi:acetyl-CoA carboxylase carboxyl transferase subunit alpha